MSGGTETDEMEVENAEHEHYEIQKPEPSIIAEKKKEEGNEFYKAKEYMNALNCYTEAINLCPTCAAYYGNRAATYMMLNKYKDALEDARQSTRIDSSFVKGYLREAKCHLALGDAAQAVRCYQQLLKFEPNNTAAKTDLEIASHVQKFEELAEADFEKKDYRRVVFYMDRCIEKCPGCARFKVAKAECLSFLSRYQEAQEIVNDIIQRDGLNPDAIYVRGICLYYQDSVDKAFQHFQQVLRLAPDHHKAKNVYRKAKALNAKKEEGNAAFRSGKIEDAYKLYSEALEIDPDNKYTNSKLYCNRATVGVKLNKIKEAVDDCTKAVELDEKYLKAYLRRAKCYMDLEQYEEAVRDYEKVYKMDKSKEHSRLLQDAKLELKKSKRKDYYKILGVTKNATDDEIKKAYKKRALIHHPDRHSHAEPQVQKEEEKKFKELGEAYSVLSDAKKKSRYDSGVDLEDLDGHSGFDVDPNQIFQAFFGGGNPGFSFGGGPGFHQQQQSGFPGGFSFQFG